MKALAKILYHFSTFLVMNVDPLLIYNLHIIISRLKDFRSESLQKGGQRVFLYAGAFKVTCINLNAIIHYIPLKCGLSLQGKPCRAHCLTFLSREAPVI